MNRKDVVIVVLATLCLMVTLFSIIPAIGVLPYSPWMDVNDDGVIDAKDYQAVKSRIPSVGTPLDKAYLAYDSGWIDITDWAGKNIVIGHGLGTMDMMVDIVGKTTIDGGIHHKQIGGEDYRIGSAWNRTFGGPDSEHGYSVAQTSDGGYAIAGSTDSYGAGADDFWLVKTDVDGNFEWWITYGGTDHDDLRSMIQTSGGGYALAGYTYSYGAGAADFYLVKTYSNGNIEWTGTYGGASYDWGSCVVETSDGGYALAGTTYSFGAGASDFWLVKTDGSGNEEWNQTYGGASYEGASSVVQTSDGGYALAGYNDSLTGYDFWLVKTDGSGNEEWNQTYSPAFGGALANSVVQTSNGEYALAGFADVYGAGTDAWLVKTDVNGIALWNKTYGYLHDEEARSVVQTSDGGLALAGWTDSLGAGVIDFWLVKTDLYGTALWSKTYGGFSQDEAFSVVQTSDGGYALAGFTYSFGDYAQMWLVKTDVNGDSDRGLFRYGLALIDSTLDTITLYRGTDDTYWNYVRVRIWQPKP